MRFKIVLLLFAGALCSCTPKGYNDGYIQYQQVKLTPDEKQILSESLKSQHLKFDSEIKMLTTTLSGWNYHTDAQTGVFHNVRSSLSYAVSLLDLGDEKYTQQAFDVIDKTISLQDQNPDSKSYGVWPYYMEEPLATNLRRDTFDYEQSR